MQVCSHQHKKDRKAQVKLFIFFTRKYLQLQDVVKKKKKEQKTTTKENIKKGKQTSKQNAHTHTHINSTKHWNKCDTAIPFQIEQMLS